MKLHEAVAQGLRDQGVEVVFGLVGDGNLYLADDFRRLGGRYVPLTHEGSIVLAAAGYHRTSGRLGVGTVTHGPGLSNTVTALVDAAKAGTPVLLIAGDTDPVDLENFQDIRQRELVEACGAGFVAARRPDLIEEDLARAIRLAVVEHRPVVLDIPIGFQWEDVERRPQPVVPLAVDAVHPDPDRVEDAAGVIASARRPLVLAGRGAIGARDELVALAARIGAPLATTAQARQLFAGERFDLGIFGGLATETATEVLGEVDTIIAVGASLNRWTTAEGSLVDGRRIVQVDLDPRALGARARPTVAVQGDAAAVAGALVALLDEAGIPSSGFAGDTLADRIAEGGAQRAEQRTRRRATEEERERTGARPAGTVDLPLAVAALETAMPADRTLVLDAGRQMYEGLAVLTAPVPSAYVHTTHFGAIGVGLPYAIGAAVGAPERPTLLVCGDGGFMLGGLVEVVAAVREHLDIAIVVFDDGSFGAEHIQLVRKGLDPAISTFDWPDLGPVAASLGADGVTVRTLAELDAALAGLAARGRGAGPLLIDVHTSADEISAAG
jgi:acetolactate synthase I/II/III large subunit